MVRTTGLATSWITGPRFMCSFPKIHVLYHLMEKSAAEVALNLCSKVFFLFWSPNILQSDNGREWHGQEAGERLARGDSTRCYSRRSCRDSIPGREPKQIKINHTDSDSELCTPSPAKSVDSTSPSPAKQSPVYIGSSWPSTPPPPSDWWVTDLIKEEDKFWRVVAD